MTGLLLGVNQFSLEWARLSAMLIIWDPPHCWPVMTAGPGITLQEAHTGWPQDCSAYFLNLPTWTSTLPQLTGVLERPRKAELGFEHLGGSQWCHENPEPLWALKFIITIHQVHTEGSIIELEAHNIPWKIKSENGRVSVVYSCVQTTPILVA